MVENKELIKVVEETVSRDDVKYVVGYKRGTYGFQIKPAFAYSAKDAKEFFYSPLCAKNLATYPLLEEKLPLRRGEEAEHKKIGIVVKGCDSRAIIQIIQEKGLEREDVVLIGIPCKGVIDPKKIAKRFPKQSKFVDVEENNNDEYILEIGGTSHKIPKDELLSDVCKSCEYPNPLLYDILIGEAEEEFQPEHFNRVDELKEKTIEERWEYWEKHFQNCIRCYACREACPLCYCKTCMVDLLEPQWVRRSVNLSENTAWNVMRAFHLAGRCISCGECERACPVNIPLMELNKFVEKEVKEMFNYTAGLDTEEKPFLGSFRPDDPEDFIS
ncbi:MAG: coenzyme F420 hydrogenase [Candidatus Heimdallarchaeota archaeon]|nr:coenzyme F420 hydrogenase [Candidatus Heimdallarchaeota archaeon]